MHKILLYIIILLICITSSIASEEHLFNGKLHYGDNFTIEDHYYLFSISSHTKDASFTSDTGPSIIVQNNTCEEREKIIFCVNNVLYDKYDVARQKEVYYAEVTISRDSADIDMVREFNKQSVTKNEHITVTLTLTNDGDAKASQIVYEDPYPSFELISANSPCEIIDSKVVYTGSLTRGSDMTCKYKLKSLIAQNYSSQAIVTYFNDIKTVNETSKEEKLTIRPSYLLVTHSGLNELKIGEQGVVKYTIKNTFSEPITPKITLDIPAIAYKLIERGKDLSLKQGLPYWSEELEEDTSIELNVTLQAIRSGSHNPTIKTKYTMSGKNVPYDIPIPIKVNTTRLIYNTNTKESYLPNETFNLKVVAQNPSPLIAFSEVEVSAINDELGINSKKEKSLIDMGLSLEIINQEIAIPILSKSTTYPITLTQSFKTPYGERITHTEVINISVIPEGQNETKDQNSTTNATQEITSTESAGNTEEVVEEIVEQVQDTVENTVEEIQNSENSILKFIKNLFGNPILIVIDIIVFLLIAYVAFAFLKDKRKKPHEQIFSDDQSDYEINRNSPVQGQDLVEETESEEEQANEDSTQEQDDTSKRD